MARRKAAESEPVNGSSTEKVESVTVPAMDELIAELQKALGIACRGTYDHYTHSIMRGAYLIKGMDGRLVQVVQMLMIRNGLNPSESGVATGIFDDAMQEAVKDAQKRFGLDATGIADADFVKHLCVD